MSESETENKTLKLYIEPNMPLISSLGRIEQGIDQERKRWQMSDAPSQLTESWFDLCDRHPQIGHFLQPPARQTVEVRLRAELFFAVRPFIATQRAFDKYSGRVGLEARDDWQIVLGIQSEYANEFREAIQNSLEERDEISEILVDKWSDFILRDYSHFADFSNFIKERQCGSNEEEIRPFLQALERRRTPDRNNIDLLDKLKKQVEQKASTEIDPILFESFIETLKGRDSSISHWVQLFSYDLETGEYQPTSATLLKFIQETGLFPGDLKQLYKSFTSQQLSDVVIAIRRNLIRYRSSENSSEASSIENLKGITRKDRRRAGIQGFTDTSSETQLPKKIRYGLILVKDLDEFDGSYDNISIQDFVISKVKAAKNNLALRNDLCVIVEALAKDPYGLGAKKLRGRENTVLTEDGGHISLMRFSPHRNPYIILTHPDSHRYRVVYHIESPSSDDSFKKLIVVDDVLQHDDFDRKYSDKN